MYRWVDLILMTEGNVNWNFKYAAWRYGPENYLITGSGEQALRITFFEILEISWPAEQLSVSEDGPCFIELVNQSHNIKQNI